MQSNITQNQTNEEESDISPVTRIVIGSVTAVPIFINIFYVIVCFKELKKKFHNLLVLMLCVGDSILSVSVTGFSMIKLTDWSATNVEMCLFQIFMVCYGLVFTYTIVLLICYERYVVVKNYNFGVHNFFERFKIAMIGGSLAGGFLVTIETVLFVPHETNISKCTVPDLYGENFQFFLTFIGIGLTLIMAGVVSYSIRTSLLIWKYFFKPLIAEVDNGCCRCSQCRAEDTNIPEQCRDSETNLDENIVLQTQEPNIMGKSVRELISKWKSQRVEEEQTRPKICTKFRQKKKIKPDAWEKRAFVTSLIIVVSTLFFTFPFILSFWLDYFTGVKSTSRETRLYLFIPLVLNSVVNPFIYAWRIPEIRQTIKNIFPCC